MCSKQLSKDNAEYFVNVSYFLAAHIFKICMYLPYHTIQRYFNNNKFLESTFEMQVTFQQKIFMYLLQYLVMKTNLQSTNNPIYIPKPNDIKKKKINKNSRKVHIGVPSRIVSINITCFSNF